MGSTGYLFNFLGKKTKDLAGIIRRGSWRPPWQSLCLGGPPYYLGRSDGSPICGTFHLK